LLFPYIFYVYKRDFFAAIRKRCLHGQEHKNIIRNPKTDAGHYLSICFFFFWHVLFLLVIIFKRYLNISTIAKVTIDVLARRIYGKTTNRYLFLSSVSTNNLLRFFHDRSWKFCINKYRIVWFFAGWILPTLRICMGFRLLLENL